MDPEVHARLVRLHDLLCRHTADMLEALASAHHTIRGHLTPSAVAWESQARRIREYIIDTTTY